MKTYVSRMKVLDRVFFARNISLLLKSGVSLADALAFVREQTKSPSITSAITHIEKEVRSGKQLNEALSDLPNLVDPFFIHVIKVGEKSGTLEVALVYLADQLEREYGLLKKIRSISLYPALVMGVIVVYAALFSYLIFPRLEKLFTGLQVDLPFLTDVILSIARWFKNWGWVAVIAVIAAALVLRAFRRIPAIRFIMEYSNNHLPLISSIVRKYQSARFFRMLAYLLQGGIPISDALTIMREATGSVLLFRSIERLRTHIESGKTLASGMEHDPFFPQLSVRLINVAEQSGSLETSCDYLATFYEREIEYSTKSFSGALEPILIIIVGLAVALLAIAIVMPIYQFTGSLSAF